MIRNIPIKYSDEMLLKELEEFMGKFDCVYLPYDAEKKGNRGYAFINFTHPLHILLFYEKFEGKFEVMKKIIKASQINKADQAKFVDIIKERLHRLELPE
jgi:RNA recognition motif-containing protein